MGQFSGSARKNKNTANSKNASGQIFAQEKYLLRESSASMPIRNTTNPAQLWLLRPRNVRRRVGSDSRLPRHERCRQRFSFRLRPLPDFICRLGDVLEVRTREA